MQQATATVKRGGPRDVNTKSKGGSTGGIGNTNKDMGGNLANHDDAVNQFYNMENNMHKQMKTLKNQNKMLYNMDKTISRREQCKVNKISPSYD